MHNSPPRFSTSFFMAVTGAVSLAIVAFAVTPDSYVDFTPSIVAISVIGYFIGFLVSRTRRHRFGAHILAIALGLLGPIGLLHWQEFADASRNRSLSYVIDPNQTRINELIDSLRAGTPFDQDLGVVVLGIVTYFIAFIAAWLLFSKSQLVSSITVPAGVLLSSLALNRDQPTWPAIAYVGLCLVLAAQSASLARANSWNLRGLGTPKGLLQWSMAVGTMFAIVATAGALAAPLRAPDQAENWIVSQSQRMADFAQDQRDTISGKSPGVAVSGNYGDFSDSFEIGSGVPSGDTPLAMVQGLNPPYLAARKFDTYDGRGWSSSFEDDAANSTDDTPPRVAFSANQPMNISDTELATRQPVTGRITTYTSGVGPMLTLETFYSASVPTAIRVGWASIDVSIPIETTQIGDVPLDLRNLVGMLKFADLENSPSGTLAPVSPELALAVAEEQQDLIDRYPLYTTLSFDSAQGPVLIAKGRLPLYDDIEAVFYRGLGNRPQTYDVTGVVPAVSPVELENALTSYPAEMDRYLQLSDTVTDRTRTLASQIVADAGASNPYDAAVAIRDYLRATYDYQLEAGPGPTGKDVVDYFLFERKTGRCDHFASSMVVMMRSLGIPARVVAGFASGEYDPTLNGYVFKGSDAHSWVEVYFPEYGWITFEPTPSESIGDVQSGVEQQNQEPLPEPTPTKVRAVETPTPAPDVAATPVAVSVQEETPGNTSQKQFSWMILISALIVAAGLIFVVSLFWNWKFRNLPVGAGYFARLTRLGGLLGVSYDGVMTPTEYADQFAQRTPRLSEPAQLISEGFSAERYGPADLVLDQNVLARAWKKLRGGVLRARLLRRG